jgi:hypothetical protein
MAQLLLPIGDKRVAPTGPQLTKAQMALRERKVLSLNSLTHGACYEGLLDDMTTVGRWHEQKRRFVFWELSMGEAAVKAAPHVADLGTGTRFAPLSGKESASGSRISDFALETTR